MNNKKIFFLLTVIAVLSLGLILSGCQSIPQNQAPDEEPLVTVSILPQAYFVERIAGEAVRVNVMVGPGDEPHTYEPTPEQMRQLSESQLFFSIGVEYEQNWIPRFEDANPNLTVVDSASGIQRIPMLDHPHDEEEAHGHETNGGDQDQDEEGEDHHHEEEGENLDPHVWLSPENGKIIAANILDSLLALAPENGTDFQKNYADLIAEIDILDAAIQATLSGLPQRTFMVFHPAWGYFAAQYGLEQIPVQVGGQDPSPSELTALVDLARQEEIPVIFIQPSFNSASAEALAEEIDAEIAMMDPLARNWLENLYTAADAFASALSE